MIVYDNNDIRVCALVAPSGSTLSREEIAAGKTALLREALPQFPDAEISNLPSGAPVICGADNFATISVSHSRTTLLLAVSRSGHPIGVDTETADRSRQLRHVAPRFLSQAQQCWATDPGLLLRAWTIKEALYKAAAIAGWPLTEIPLPQLPPQTNSSDRSDTSDLSDPSDMSDVSEKSPLAFQPVDTPSGIFAIIPIPTPPAAGLSTLAVRIS